MTPDEIELYKDIAKIGIPALTGLVAGLTPFFLERTKLKKEIVREEREFRRKQIIELIDCFSKFLGNLSVYISMLFSKKNINNEEFDLKVYHAGESMLSNEINLSKVKAISGLVGDKKLVTAFHDYDRQASNVINLLVGREGKSDEEKKEVVTELRNKENELIFMLNKLS